MTEFTGVTTEDQFEEGPMRIFKGKFEYSSNDPNFEDGKHFGKEFPVEVELAVHPNSSKRIIINVPGISGDIDGYADKYRVLASHMQADNLGAVIRTGNRFIAGYLVDINLRAALQYARENAREICGDAKPEVMLMGFSAGASAIAAIASEYPEVAAILLYAPSGDMGQEAVRSGLKDFKGEVYIIQGENDEVVGPQAGKLFAGMATGAKHKELFMIPNCDHQFRGEANGRIMSEAPYYAFSKGTTRPTFPDPNGGIKLYS
jgi:pimeloyl-ACP methyl ester carboxylesterase